MKKIEAIIRPFKLEEVKNALGDAAGSAVTISEVRGVCDDDAGCTHVYRGAAYVVNLLKALKLEMVVTDELAPQVMAAIESAARTGRAGDTSIFVTEIDEAIRIRTAERGDMAL